MHIFLDFGCYSRLEIFTFSFNVLTIGNECNLKYLFLIYQLITMGFFDNLKKIKNYITGSGAELHIAIDNSTLSTEGVVRVKILCQVKDHDILVDKLYVKLKAEEIVRYRDHGSSHHSGGHVRKTGGSMKTAYATTHQEEIIVDQNFRLDQGGEYEWNAEFLIPADIPGTYNGINARHEWKILAGLSKKGVDPDSGWQVFIV